MHPDAGGPLMAGPHRGVPASGGDEFGVGAPFDDAAPVQHDDLVGPGDGVQPVRDDQHCAPAGELGQRVLDGGLGVGIGVSRDHHVGDRDSLVRLVVDRLVAAVDSPDPELSWQDWFRDFLGRWPQWLRDYSGVAEFLVLNGPVVPSALAILDQGMTTLLRAGFGADAPAAYSMLLNTAALQMAVVDRRRRQNVPIHSWLGAAMDAVPDAGPGLLAMREFVRTFADNPERAATARDEYFRTSIDVVIAGWEQRLIGR